MFDALLSNLTPESITLILTAIVGNLAGSEALKMGLGKLLGLAKNGTSGLPIWVKRYVLPTVGATLIAVGVGMPATEYFGLLEAYGIGDLLKDTAVLSIVANVIFRWLKGKPQEA